MRYHVNQYKCPFCDMTSPSPSNMRLHIKYRHSEEKPYKCDSCTYKCKSLADLRKHQEKHSDEDHVKCEVPDCNYKAKNYKSLENHFRRLHEKSNTSYQCHVCEASFWRGSSLTNHLKTKHKFNWPAGHSRFRYKRHSDGKFRLQTVRYESVELTTQEDPSSSSQSSSASSSSSGQQLCDMPDLTEPSSSQSTEGVILIEKVDDSSGSSEHSSGNDVCLVSVIDSSGNTTSQQVVRTKTGNTASSRHLLCENAEFNTNNSNNVSHKENDNSEMVITVEHCDGDFSVNQAEETDEEAVEIRVVTNEKGEYMIQNDNNGTKETIGLGIHEDMEFEEETMYNLQMLGEVALQDKYQEVKNARK